MRRGKKRIAAGMVMVCVMAASVLPAYAADNELTVRYQKGATYTLNIPIATVNLSETEEKTATIGLSAINVGTKQSVEIKVSNGIDSNGIVTLTDEKDSSNTATSTVSLTSGGSGITTDTVVGKFISTTTAESGTGTLYFTALGNVQAGTYSGVLTFVASIVDEETVPAQITE